MANGEKKPERKVEDKIIGTSGDLRTTTRAATGTVIVGCKLPNGIILQLCRREASREPVMGGGHRDVDVWRKFGDKYVVKGPAVPFGTVPKYLIAGGYALTSGIPEDFWEQWLAQNAESDIVKNELIIAHKTMEDVENQCIGNENHRSGLEPIDPRRLPKGVTTAEEQPRA